MKILFIFLVSILSFNSFAQEENDIQYVTGKLYLSLYQQADSGSKVLKSLVSGDRLEVIEIAGPYANVITSNDQEGWVKRGFLVKGKPASILYKESEKANKTLLKEMAIYKDKNGALSELKAVLQTLKQENSELLQIKEVFLRQKEANENKSTEVSTAEANKIDLTLFKAFIKEYSLFLLASLILLVLVGFRLGELKTESDVIKHFGGVKVW
jgi:SH3 domain protein